MAVVQKDPSTPDSPAGGSSEPTSGGGNFNKAAFVFAVIEHQGAESPGRAGDCRHEARRSTADHRDIPGFFRHKAP